MSLSSTQQLLAAVVPTKCLYGFPTARSNFVLRILTLIPVFLDVVTTPR
jgi:hypothetical protein